MCGKVQNLRGIDRYRATKARSGVTETIPYDWWNRQQIEVRRRFGTSFSIKRLTMLRYHVQILAIACAALALAFALEELPDGRVAFRGLARIPLPQTCFSRSWLGLKCPGCGLTRSIVHLAEGDWNASWRSHRLGSLLALAIAVQFPYRLLALSRLGRPLLGPRQQAVLAYTLIAIAPGKLAGRPGLAAGRLASRLAAYHLVCQPVPAGFTRRDQSRCPNRMRFPKPTRYVRLCRGRESPTRAPSCSSARPVIWLTASSFRRCFSSRGGQPSFRMRDRRFRPPRLDG